MDWLWRKIRVPRTREMHRDGDRRSSTTKETGWSRIGKEERPNPAPHYMRNLDYSHSWCMGVISAPLFCTHVWGYFPVNFVPEWKKLNANFCSPSQETAGICRCRRKLWEVREGQGTHMLGVPTLWMGLLLLSGRGRASNEELNRAVKRAETILAPAGINGSSGC